MSSLKDFRIDPERFYVCACREHQSVLEIFSGSELLKLCRSGALYEVLSICPDRDRAMIFVQSALKKCLTIDPALETPKQDLEEIYG